MLFAWRWRVVDTFKALSLSLFGHDERGRSLATFELSRFEFLYFAFSSTLHLAFSFFPL